VKVFGKTLCNQIYKSLDCLKSEIEGNQHSLQLLYYLESFTGGFPNN
jgi:hypothetical protein